MTSAISRLPNVVLDLDGTIIFSEQAEILIPGASGGCYVAQTTVSLLESISAQCHLHIASVRRASSVAGLVQALPNVRFAGYVLEGGLVSRTDISASPEVCAVRERISRHLQAEFRDWRHVDGYEKMICCIAPSSVINPLSRVSDSLHRLAPTPFPLIEQERHKTFISPTVLCKFAGLQRLGVTRIDVAAGDDERYDRSLLASADYPLTFATSAASLVEFVKNRGGYVASEAGHRGAEEVLTRIRQWLMQYHQLYDNHVPQTSFVRD